MIDRGKQNVLGVLVDAVDYDAAVERVMSAARERRAYGVSALAVHGVMTGVKDAEHRYRLNALDLVTADGQPVRWAMNWLHGTGLRDRVYGPDLTLRLLAAAAEQEIPAYFYGSRPEVLDALVANMRDRFPRLRIAGSEPSKFRRLDEAEMTSVAERIRDSGAQLTFVGLGCPRQEVFVYEQCRTASMPLIAVGAAFDYHAGLIDEPPRWIQDRGLQWAYRLVQDPRRLWRRYVLLNPEYMLCVILQWTGWWRADPALARRPETVVGYA